MGIEDIKAAFRRRQTTARVLLDQTLLVEHARLDADLQRAVVEDAKHNRVPESFALSEQIRELEQTIDDAQRTFTFEGIGRGPWMDLVANHPPSPSDRRDGLDFNSDTFPPAAVAKCCIDPVLTYDEALWLYTELDVAEWSRLWEAVLLANLGTRDRPKSLVATAAAIVKDASSTIASREESNGQSS